MRGGTALKTGGLIAAAAGLGLLATQGTLALWNSIAPVELGVIRAADFTVTLSDESARSLDMTGAVEIPFSLTDVAPLAGLYPGKAVYAAVQLSNGTNATSDFDVQVAIAEPPAITSEWAHYLQVRSQTAASFAACPETGAGYSAVAPGSPIALIPKGASSVLCLELTLAANAPASLQGAPGTATLRLSAAQL